MAESLVNTPIYVHHGDMDEAVNVDWSRWGVKLLQRWGYDVRYHEYPGKVHEALAVSNVRDEHRVVPEAQARSESAQGAHPLGRAAQCRRVVGARAAGGTPLDFMRVDAEVVDRNVIRLDTDNVLDIVLTPGAALVDPAKPVRVVWNGVARDLRMQRRRAAADQHRLQTGAAAQDAGAAGRQRSDFFMTPFAVVVGHFVEGSGHGGAVQDEGAGHSSTHGRTGRSRRRACSSTPRSRTRTSRAIR